MMTTQFQGRRILITGGLGFIGSNLARRLVDLGAEVLLIDSLIPDYGGNLFNIADLRDRLQVNISDIRDHYSLRHLLQGADYLFNLAGQLSHSEAMHRPLEDLAVNGQAQLSLLEICRQVNPDIKIIYTSTRQVYGKAAYLPVDEQHPLIPPDINSVHKLTAEHYHRLYHQLYGLRTCILRLTSTYGPGMRIKDARQTFLGIWMRLLLEGRPFDVWGGSQRRDYTYVADVVDALLLAALNPKSDGKIFNLGGNQIVSLEELAQLLVKTYGKGEYQICEFSPERKMIDLGDFYSNYQFIQSELDWIPKVSLEDGISKTIAFYQENLKQYV